MQCTSNSSAELLSIARPTPHSSFAALLGSPLPETPSLGWMVADAEKAYVHRLRPKYNSRLYANYPRGKDDLYPTALLSPVPRMVTRIISPAATMLAIRRKGLVPTATERR
jgi:hypothetical protein